jgi:hypothetical protein
LERLPGWEIISAGLADIDCGRTTPFACAVWIASSRLRRYGLLGDHQLSRRIAEPERALYRLLGEAGGNAYGRYNAILQRLSRFEHALDHAVSRHLSRT